MKIQLTPGNVSKHEELVALKKVLLSRMKEATTFMIDLTHTNGIDLAQFNILVSVHMSFKRLGKTLIYNNCKDQGLTNLISKTNFSHVFEI